MIKKIVPIVLVVILLAGALYLKQSVSMMSPEKAGQKTVDFINKMNEMMSYGGDVLEIELIGVTTESGLYKIQISVEGEEETIYATKDGKFYIPTVFDIEKTLTETEEQKKEEEIPTTDVPHVELFVVSFCPYSTLAEQTLFPVYNLLKDKVDWDFRYITEVVDGVVYSMHGEIEAEQNQREACVLEKFGVDKWWQFVNHINANCENDALCWEEAAQIAGLDVSSINNCVSSEEGLSLMEREAAITNVVGVIGSPTLIINGAESNAVYNYGNSQAYLDTICSAFNSPPEECFQELDVSDEFSFVGGSCE